MKRGFRVVHGDKELAEKLGRNDPCPCGSRRSFQEVLHADGPLRWHASRSLLLENDAGLASADCADDTDEGTSSSSVAQPNDPSFSATSATSADGAAVSSVTDDPSFFCDICDICDICG